MTTPEAGAVYRHRKLPGRRFIALKEINDEGWRYIETRGKDRGGMHAFRNTDMRRSK